MQETDGLASKAYYKMRDAILRGELAPGEVLFETYQADKLGMSRTPVREALKVLARDGFVEKVSSGGHIVPRRSVEDLRELFELRESLEGLASRCAALRATDTEIKELEHLCDVYERAKGLEAWNQIGSEFHNKIFAASRNSRLTRFLDSLKAQIALTRRWALQSTRSRQDMAIREHRAILNAIKAHDPSAAESRARAHVRRSYEANLRVLQPGALGHIGRI